MGKPPFTILTCSYPGKKVGFGHLTEGTYVTYVVLSDQPNMLERHVLNCTLHFNW